MRKFYQLFLCIVLAGMLILPQSFGTFGVKSSFPSAGKGLSIIPLSPYAIKILQEQGKSLHFLFPNSLNRGKKFNPRGETIPPLVTDPIQKVLVVFVQFTTLPPGGPSVRLNLQYFDNMLFGDVYDPPEYWIFPAGAYPTDRTLKNYFREVSYNQVQVVTLNMPSAMGWTQVGRPYDYYCKADGLHDNGFGPYPQNAQGLVVDAVQAVDPLVDFSQYAVDGEVPNLFVVFAGTGAEWSADPSLIWSHSWDISSGTGLDGLIVDGVKINNYAVMPEVGGDLTAYLGTVYGPYPPTVGVYAHEYGHVLGLPDQYDYGYESNGTGMYSLMASGNWNGYPPQYMIFWGNSPAHLDAWSKYRLGFVVPQEITDAANVTIPPAEIWPVAYKMTVPFSGGKEYFLFENRQSIGFDQGLCDYWNRKIHGLAIYHVDETVLNRNYWVPNEAENWKEFRSEGWRKAWTGETHYGISIIQADDRWDLEHSAWAYGDIADLYPGALGVKKFGNNTWPNSSNYYFWAGAEPKFGYSGVTVENIQETGGMISAKMSFIPWSPKK